MSRPTLHFLGPPRVELDGAPLKLQYRKNLALIAYLCITGGSHTREALITLLWPELNPSRARANLRRNLSVLRTSLGAEWLVAEHETIGLALGTDLDSDVEEFRCALALCYEHDHPEGSICQECLDACPATIRKGHQRQLDLPMPRGDVSASWAASELPTRIRLRRAASSARTLFISRPNSMIRL